MGYYHGSFPENVQQNKKRHICNRCGKKRFEKFMVDKSVFIRSPTWVCKENCILKEW